MASGHGTAETTPNLDKLMMRVAAEHARKLLDLGYDSRLEPFNDPKAARITQLTAAKVAINALLQFMAANGLAPNAITDGVDQS